MEAGIVDREVVRRSRRGHGFIADPLVDHDTPVCEVCHGYMESHESEALAHIDRVHAWELVETLRAALQALVNSLDTGGAWPCACEYPKCPYNMAHEALKAR